jgi:two-component system sensor histidine kinase KdpD
VLVRHVLAGAAAVEAGRHPGLRIEVDAPAGLPPVAGDQTLVEQVVRNLIGNAVKYAGPHASIALAARVVEGSVEVSITDDGPGIPEADRAAIFDIFFRSRSTAARARGAGIGLFVCRRLVESMDGRIWATEAPGGGACLRFALPIYASDLPADDVDGGPPAADRDVAPALPTPAATAGVLPTSP